MAQMDPFQTTGTRQLGQEQRQVVHTPECEATSSKWFIQKHFSAFTQLQEVVGAVVLCEAREGQICNLALAQGQQLTLRLGDHRLHHPLPEEAVLASPASCQ